MKKLELEQALNDLKAITTIANKQDYNTSTGINRLVNSVSNVLNTEYKRLDEDKIDITCPRMFVDFPDVEINITAIKLNMVEKMNEKLKEFVMRDYKIIDFGLEENYFYIKYTM